MDYIKVVESRKEMAEIGKRIIAEQKAIYTPLMLSKIRDRIKQEYPDVSEEVREDMLNVSIYDFWIYGNNIDEEFYYHFYEKTHAEKSTYLTDRVRTLYVDYLSCGSPYIEKEQRNKIIDQLEMKYECYKLLKPYYKRDVIEIKSESDFSVFEEFVNKHNVFVAKPSDYSLGTGVHKVDIKDYKNTKEAFESLLSEGVEIKRIHPSRRSSMVLEELIIQDEGLAKLHPASVNAIRATAVRDRNGKVVLLHPWIKVAVGGQFVSSAAFAGFDAEIDVETGKVISDGYSENGKIYKVHPDTGIQIKGYQIPKWDELKIFLQEVMDQIPTYGYAGWDLVLTAQGWCVMEVNYSGECMWQLINGCGGKKELEDLIGWKPDKEFWWQIRPFPVAEVKS